MSFVQIDEARKLAASASISGKREKKRKTATIARLNPEISAVGISGEDQSVSELRTGRWTNEEMLYCDKMTEKFEHGQLPVMDGVKLNDFLARMLKSKQSRLTKKMKNAKLSAKTFHRTTGYIPDAQEARLFSELEEAFLRSIPCTMERAEVRFHLQKEWRELFSAFCVHVGQKLEADDWLSSVEEMDRRDSRAKDAARMARRKKIVSVPLPGTQGEPVSQGVFMDGVSGGYLSGSDHESNPASKRMRQDETLSRRLQSPPFLSKIIAFMERHRIPFEHVDAWVPSFVNQQQAAQANSQTCRLCFAGAASTGVQVPADGRGSIPLSTDDILDFYAFGEYSQKFSFEVGSGLPGRVYQSGIPSWERSVHHAPISHFERCGGALQCGIKTVLGIPVPSPNVGRIVLILYSRHDRIQSQELVGRLVNEVAKLKPYPKWRLVVDLGSPPPVNPIPESPPPIISPSPDPQVHHASASSCPTTTIIENASTTVNTINKLFALLQEQLTLRSPDILPHFDSLASLRQLLLKNTKTPKENEVVQILLQSYEAYASNGRVQGDLAVLIAHDFVALSR